MARNLEAGSPVAAMLARLTSRTTVQLKGPVVEVAAPTQARLDAVSAHVDGFVAETALVGVPEADRAGAGRRRPPDGHDRGRRAVRRHPRPGRRAAAVSDVVGLESIRDCLRAGLPSPMATCAPDGTPHISYILQVQYLDRERVATSRQPFNRALADLDACPYAQALVVRPVTAEEFRLDLQLPAHGHRGRGVRGDAREPRRDRLAHGHGPGLPAARPGRAPRAALHAGSGAGPASRSAPSSPIRSCRSSSSRAASSAPTTYEEATHEVIDALDDLFGFRYAVAARGRGHRRRHRVDRHRREPPARDRHGEPRPGARDGRGDRRPRRCGRARPRRPGRGPERRGGPARRGQGRPRRALSRERGAERVRGADRGPAADHRRARRRRAGGARRARHRPARASGDPPIELVYYQADDTVLCDSAYIVKGAPGRILWSMLKAHVDSGRTQFSNRELRLDESLELPAGNDNLEARLLVLRRRLADLGCGVVARASRPRAARAPARTPGRADGGAHPAAAAGRAALTAGRRRRPPRRSGSHPRRSRRRPRVSGRGRCRARSA